MNEITSSFQLDRVREDCDGIEPSAQLVKGEAVP